MANISSIKLPNGTTYNLKDNGALPLTGGTVTGPVTFGDSISVDEATLGDLIVNGSANFTNNIQANTINGAAVGNSPKFTDTVTTVTTTGSGNAVTAITASNGALTVTKGTTFLTSHQDISGKADKATTLSGYGITDAKISNGTITLGSNTITPLTSYTETDPVFKASAAAGITSSDITNWNGKQAALVSGTNIKTVNGNSLLGSGNISISYSDFIGTDGTAAGTHGLVPAPATTDSGKFLSADGTWAEPPGSGSSISYVTKTENTYTTTLSSETTIPIGIQTYSSTDVLLVDINGLDLIQGTDYTISGTNIVLTTPITTIGTKVHFTALKMTTATTSDYATLKGEKGDDGHSPVVTASKSGTTTTVYVDGSSIASINDGTNGTHTISYTPIVTGGAQIGTITIDNTSYPLYAPAVVWG